MAAGPNLPPGVSAPPGTPAWLTPIIQVTTQLGFPAVVAGVLLWFVLTRVGGTLDLIQKQEEDRTRIVAAMQDSLIATLDRQTDRFEKAIRDNIEANKLIAADIHRDRRPREREP